MELIPTSPLGVHHVTDLEDAAAWLNTNGTLGTAWVWNNMVLTSAGQHVYPNRYLVKIGRHVVVMDTNEFNEVFR